MARSNSRLQLRLLFLLAVLAGLVAVWSIQRVRYWSVNRFAEEALRHGAGVEGSYDSATEFEEHLDNRFGIRYPSRMSRVYRIDMLAARDIDGLLTQIDEAAGVECLKIGPGLRSADSLEPLGRLARLTDLIIVARNADDRWLESAVRAPQLRRVSLRDGRITDHGLELLARVRSLTTLRIPDSDAGDAGLAHLAGSKDLVELDLRGSGISDASIPVLEALPNLKELNLVRTKISAAGAERLRAGGTRRVFH